MKIVQRIEETDISPTHPEGGTPGISSNTSSSPSSVFGAVSSSVEVTPSSIVGSSIVGSSVVGSSVVAGVPVATPVTFTLYHSDTGVEFSPLKHDILAVNSFDPSVID